MAITIKCKRGTGDREASSISNSLISSESMAVAVGKRFLDDNYYVKMVRTMRVPHKNANVVPESWVTVTDGHLGLTNQLLKVIGYTIEITPNFVGAIIETEQYKVES